MIIQIIYKQKSEDCSFEATYNVPLIGKQWIRHSVSVTVIGVCIITFCPDLDFLLFYPINLCSNVKQMTSLKINLKKKKEEKNES
jgi:hypothetical protein